MNNNIANNLSLILQMVNLQLLFQDFNNSDLMQELKVINKQNTEIIQLLKERSYNDGKTTG